MVDAAQVGNGNPTEGVNSSLLCGKDPVYYTSIIGIVVDYVIFIIGLPLVCLACYALLSLIKRDKAAPIFLINLLLTDLLQIAITAVFILSRVFHPAHRGFLRARCVARLFVRLGLTSSLGFMLLISAERYVMVAWPVWYHTHNTAKVSAHVSLGMWAVALVYSSLDYAFLVRGRASLLLFSVICLLPAPWLALLFAATWRSLNKSAAMRNEKNIRTRVLGALGVVLGAYYFLFVPFSFRNLYYSHKDDGNAEAADAVRDLSGVLTSAMVYLSPLTDCMIYIFIRKDVRDTVDSFPCCKTLLRKFRGKDLTEAESSQKETTLQLH